MHPLAEARGPTVAIVGAGLSGTLVAANLLRRAGRPLRIALIERSGDFGPGVAYSTDDRRHRLNVPAARMSAFPDAPLHFLTWARRRLQRKVRPDEFLTRRTYGDYLRDLLAEERRRAPAAQLDLVTASVDRIERRGAGVQLELGDGRSLRADAAVLATGSLPPRPLPELPADPRVIADPWASGALDRCSGSGVTVLIGTSLTAADLALTIAGEDPAARVIAVSRHGLLPHRHLPGLRDPAPAPRIPAGTQPLAKLVSEVQDHVRHMVCEGYDWRDAVDGIRPCVPSLWQRLSTSDRRRFLEEHARGWEVRRHRVAPAVARRVDELRASGRLEIAAARIASARARPDAIELTLAGGQGRRVVRAGRVVCCTGAGNDVRRGGTLIEQLIDDGLAVSDPLGLGLRAGRCGALIDAAGSARGPLYTLGPPLRGELWETTAAREIRLQAESVAADLCDGLDVVGAADGSAAGSAS